MDQRAGLSADGLGHGGMAMAQADHGDAREEIEVFLAVGVPEAAAQSPDEGEFPLAVGVDDVFVVQRFDFLGIHRFDLSSLPFRRRPRRKQKSPPAEVRIHPRRSRVEDFPDSPPPPAGE